MKIVRHDPADWGLLAILFNGFGDGVDALVGKLHEKSAGACGPDNAATQPRDCGLEVRFCVALLDGDQEVVGDDYRDTERPLSPGRVAKDALFNPDEGLLRVGAEQLDAPELLLFVQRRLSYLYNLSTGERILLLSGGNSRSGTYYANKVSNLSHGLSPAKWCQRERKHHS